MPDEHGKAMYLKLPENDAYQHWGTRENAFSKEECAKICELFEKLPREPGAVRSGGPELKERHSSIAWLRYNSESEWIYKKYWEALKAVNDAHYRYDLTMLQTIQLTQYGVDQHYSWHTDMAQGKFSIRKLSASVLLTDPGIYDGGELAFHINRVQKAPRGLGTLVYFPSYVSHCVEPVTRGSRLSMVAWVVGPPLR